MVNITKKCLKNCCYQGNKIEKFLKTEKFVVVEFNIFTCQNFNF